ncbi:MAG: cell division protein FtsQ [Paenibacillaceae bacterium]|nr:cell division protein FtsQ [Paenibacillaceae bacterium]
MVKALMAKKQELNSSQKLMIFILSMSLYGISNMITELLPEFHLGPVEFKVEYFIFIPLTLAVLFHPLYAALGASFGELIFGELLLGQFGGLGELEKFIEFSLAIYFAGKLVTNPLSKRQLALAAYVSIGIDQLLGTIVDISKVWVGIEELETVSGLPESILAIEGFSFLNAMVVSGTLFALLPTLYLVPRLFGKVEPLLGLRPRDRSMRTSLGEVMTPRAIVLVILLVASSFVVEFLAESDITLVEWEWSALADMGNGAVWISMGVAALVLVVALIVFAARKSGKGSGASV